MVLQWIRTLGSPRSGVMEQEVPVVEENVDSKETSPNTTSGQVKVITTPASGVVRRKNIRRRRIIMSDSSSEDEACVGKCKNVTSSSKVIPVSAMRQPVVQNLSTRDKEECPGTSSGQRATSAERKAAWTSYKIPRMIPRPPLPPRPAPPSLLEIGNL